MGGVIMPPLGEHNYAPHGAPVGGMIPVNPRGLPRFPNGDPWIHRPQQRGGAEGAAPVEHCPACPRLIARARFGSRLFSSKFRGAFPPKSALRALFNVELFGARAPPLSTIHGPRPTRSLPEAPGRPGREPRRRFVPLFPSKIHFCGFCFG